MILSDFFIYDLVDVKECTDSKFRCHTLQLHMLGVVSTLEDRVRIQNNLDKTDKWPIINQMEFKQDKCKVLHLR